MQLVDMLPVNRPNCHVLRAVCIFTLTLGVLVLHAYYTCRSKCRLGRRQDLALTPRPLIARLRHWLSLPTHWMLVVQRCCILFWNATCRTR